MSFAAPTTLDTDCLSLPCRLLGFTDQSPSLVNGAAQSTHLPVWFTWNVWRPPLVCRFGMHQGERELHSHVSAHNHSSELQTFERDSEAPELNSGRLLTSSESETAASLTLPLPLLSGQGTMEDQLTSRGTTATDTRGSKTIGRQRESTAAVLCNPILPSVHLKGGCRVRTPLPERAPQEAHHKITGCSRPSLEDVGDSRQEQPGTELWLQSPVHALHPHENHQTTPDSCIASANPKLTEM